MLVRGRELERKMKLKGKFEEYVQKATGIATKMDFKKMNKEHFFDFSGGHSILHQYNGFIPFFRSIYPIFQWTIFDIDRMSNHYWDDPKNQLFFFEELHLKEPNLFKTYENWLQLNGALIKRYSGAAIVIKNLSILKVLETNFIGFNWSSRGKFPTNSSEEPKRVYMDQFIINLSIIRSAVDFPLLSCELLFNEPRGLTILEYYENNPQMMMKALYPEIMSSVSKGRRVYRGFWNNLKYSDLHLRLIKGYGIECKGDWYRVSVGQLSEVYGKVMSRRYLMKVLCFCYPEEEWEEMKFLDRMNKRARQRYLGMKVREMGVPWSEGRMLEDFVFKDGNVVYIFDYYFPEQKLVIEYQGEQHYFSVISWIPLEEQQKKDEEKRKMCLRYQIKVVYVPYWWDNSLESLKQIINSQLSPNNTT